MTATGTPSTWERRGAGNRTTAQRQKRRHCVAAAIAALPAGRRSSQPPVTHVTLRAPPAPQQAWHRGRGTHLGHALCRVWAVRGQEHAVALERSGQAVPHERTQPLGLR